MIKHVDIDSREYYKYTHKLYFYRAISGLSNIISIKREDCCFGHDLDLDITILLEITAMCLYVWHQVSMIEVYRAELDEDNRPKEIILGLTGI